MRDRGRWLNLHPLCDFVSDDLLFMLKLLLYRVHRLLWWDNLLSECLFYWARLGIVSACEGLFLTDRLLPCILKWVLFSFDPIANFIDLTVVKHIVNLRMLEFPQHWGWLLHPDLVFNCRSHQILQTFGIPLALIHLESFDTTRVNWRTFVQLLFYILIYPQIFVVKHSVGFHSEQALLSRQLGHLVG